MESSAIERGFGALHHVDRVVGVVPVMVAVSSPVKNCSYSEVERDALSNDDDTRQAVVIEQGTECAADLCHLGGRHRRCGVVAVAIVGFVLNGDGPGLETLAVEALYGLQQIVRVVP